MAISVCMCLKVGDASTLFNFVNDWATMNRNHNEEEGGGLLLPFPQVLDAGASVFPHGDKTIWRRFVFEGSKIESLKAMVSSGNVQNPTRVEVVTA